MGHERPGPERAATPVEDAVRALLRAVHTLRTYPADNQLSRKALADMQVPFAAAGALDLALAGAELLRDGEVVVEADQDRASVVAALYRDGVRRLQIREGVGADELERLVRALAKPIHPDDLSEDYVTRLWEAELPHVQVTAVDPYLDLDVGGDVLEGRAKPELSPEEAPTSEPDLPPPPTEAFRITEEDARRIAREVELGEKAAPWGQFVNALIGALFSAPGLRRLEELVQLVEACQQRLLEDGHLKLAVQLLRYLRGKLPAQGVAPIRAALLRMAGAQRLLPLHERIEKGACDLEDAAALLALLRPAVAESAVQLLERSLEEAARRFYAQFLVQLGAEALPPLLERFREAGDDVRAALAGVLGRLREPRAAQALREALPAAKGGLRREIVRALSQHAGGEAEAALLEVALRDPDAGCRILALRSMGSRGARVAQRALVERIRSRGFDAVPAEEKDLVFATLGRVGDDAIVPFLEGMLQPSWLPGLGRRDHQLRAALALSRLGTEAALAVLERLSRSRRADLAQICERALLEARRGAT
jgi:hypothetical protein